MSDQRGQTLAHCVTGELLSLQPWSGHRAASNKRHSGGGTWGCRMFVFASVLAGSSAHQIACFDPACRALITTDAVLSCPIFTPSIPRRQAMLDTAKHNKSPGAQQSSSACASLTDLLASGTRGAAQGRLVLAAWHSAKARPYQEARRRAEGLLELDEEPQRRRRDMLASERPQTLLHAAANVLGSPVGVLMISFGSHGVLVAAGLCLCADAGPGVPVARDRYALVSASWSGSSRLGLLVRAV